MREPDAGPCFAAHWIAPARVDAILISDPARALALPFLRAAGYTGDVIATEAAADTLRFALVDFAKQHAPTPARQRPAVFRWWDPAVDAAAAQANALASAADSAGLDTALADSSLDKATLPASPAASANPLARPLDECFSRDAAVAAANSIKRAAYAQPVPLCPCGRLRAVPHASGVGVGTALWRVVNPGVDGGVCTGVLSGSAPTAGEDSSNSGRGEGEDGARRPKRIRHSHSAEDLDVVLISAVADTPFRHPAPLDRDAFCAPQWVIVPGAVRPGATPDIVDAANALVRAIVTAGDTARPGAPKSPVTTPVPTAEPPAPSKTTIKSKRGRRGKRTAADNGGQLTGISLTTSTAVSSASLASGTPAATSAATPAAAGALSTSSLPVTQEEPESPTHNASLPAPIILPLGPTDSLLEMIEIIYEQVLGRRSASIDGGRVMHIVNGQAQALLDAANVLGEWMHPTRAARAFLPEYPLLHTSAARASRLVVHDDVQLLFEYLRRIGPSRNGSASQRGACLEDAILFVSPPHGQTGDAHTLLNTWNTHGGCVIYTDPTPPIFPQPPPPSSSTSPAAASAVLPKYLHIPFDPRVDMPKLMSFVAGHQPRTVYSLLTPHDLPSSSAPIPRATVWQTITPNLPFSSATGVSGDRGVFGVDGDDDDGFITVTIPAHCTRFIPASPAIALSGLLDLTKHRFNAYCPPLEVVVGASGGGAPKDHHSAVHAPPQHTHGHGHVHGQGHGHGHGHVNAHGHVHGHGGIGHRKRGGGQWRKK